MMSHVYRYMKDGELLVEHLDAAQGMADVATLRDFEALEATAQNAEDFAALRRTGMFDAVIDSCRERVASLTPGRRAYWYTEFNRLGLSVAPAAPPPPAGAPKPTVSVDPAPTLRAAPAAPPARPAKK